MRLANLALILVMVRVTLNWNDVNTTEQGTIIYREIAGTFQPVGEVGPNATTFSETFSAVEGGQLPYQLKIFNATGEVFSNEWVGVVPTPPCKQKGKSGKCR